MQAGQKTAARYFFWWSGGRSYLFDIHGEYSYTSSRKKCPIRKTKKGGSYVEKQIHRYGLSVFNARNHPFLRRGGS